MDVDATVLDHHPLEHGADELLPGVKVERGERATDAVDKGLEVSLELRLLLGCLPLGVQHFDTAVDVSPPLPQPSLTLPELIEVDESGLIGVEQSVFLATKLGQLLLQRGQVVAQAVVPRRRGLGPQAHVSFTDQGWVLEVAADLAPDKCVQLIRPQISLRATADGAARHQHVVTRTVIVVVERAVASAHAVTGHCQVTHATADHATEQIVAGLEMAGAEAAVVVVDRLGTTKQFGVDDRGNRERNPLGRRAVLVAR